jgi:zinc-binding alcohol dehydrogenase/oxidoreductase
VRAWQLTQLGGPARLVYGPWPDPVPGPGEVVVAIRAAAVNRRDLYLTYGLYPGIRVPAVLGSDGAGTVVALGPGVPADWLGRSVLVNPALDWGPDSRVAGPSFSILGVPRDGTWADAVAVPVENIAPMPPHLSWEEGAAWPLAGLTAYRALVTRGALKPGEAVLIPGVGGGVASLALVLANALHARVAVTSGDDAKLDRARALGAAVAARYDQAGWAERLKRDLGGGADLVVDGVGGDIWPDLLHVLKPGGRLVAYGATRGPVPSLALPRLFLKHIDVRGTSMGSPEDFRGLLELVARYALRPVISHVFPMAKAQEALALVEEGTQFGKVVLVNG